MDATMTQPPLPTGGGSSFLPTILVYLQSHPTTASISPPAVLYQLLVFSHRHVRECVILVSMFSNRVAGKTVVEEVVSQLGRL
jgi:hypothetical protein